MRLFLAFTLSVCVQICCGRYFNRRDFEYEPGIPLRDFALLDEVCEDDPDYADACPEKAAIKDYCLDQEDFMRKNCPKSCGFCSKATSQPAVSTESVKPPAPAAVCEDDPDYADGCPEKAAIKDYCQDQEDFMRKNCPKSCGFCSKATAKPAVSTESVNPPAPAVCEDDPDYADGCPEKAAIKNYCQDQEDFMRKNCPKSCGFCSEATVQPAVITESVKSPAPAAECKDDPEYADNYCKDIAATTGLCEEQKEFTQEYCAFSCDWCESPITKAPIQGKPPPISSAKPPSPPAFCRDRDRNCAKWKSLGFCGNLQMAIYCGVTCDTCKAPTPDECFDKKDNCEDLKKAGFCTSTVPIMEYEVKTNCLETCEFCVPDFP